MAPIFDWTYYNSNSKLIISLLIISSKEQSAFFSVRLLNLLHIQFSLVMISIYRGLNQPGWVQRETRIWIWYIGIAGTVHTDTFRVF